MPLREVRLRAESARGDAGPDDRLCEGGVVVVTAGGSKHVRIRVVIGLPLVLMWVALWSVAAPSVLGKGGAGSSWPPHEPNRYTPFTYGGGGALWPSDAPTQVAADFATCVGVARFGQTYLFSRQSDGSIAALPYKFPLPPSSKTPPVRGGDPITVLNKADFDKLVGVCEVGGPDPDIFILYTKPGDTAHLYWRKYTEGFTTAHSAAFPYLADLAYDADNHGRLVGSVVAVDDAVVIASRGATSQTSGNVDLYSTDLQGTVTVKHIAAGAQVRSIAACALSHSDRSVLALGWLAGTPTDLPSDYRSFAAFGDYQAMIGAVALLDEQLNVTSRKDLPLSQAPPVMSHGFGHRDIAIVQGGVKQAAKGDAVQVLVRSGGYDKIHHTDPPYSDCTFTQFQWEVLNCWGLTIDPDDDTAIASMTHDAANYFRDGWYKDVKFTGYTQREWWGASACSETSFFAFPVLDGSPTQGNSSYDTYRQYIFWSSAVTIQNQPGNGNWGSLGTVGSLFSDGLVPVQTDTTDEDGDPLAQPITYPARMPLPPDPSQWDLIGVVYGVPPFCLQGKEWGDWMETSPVSTYGFETEDKKGTANKTKQAGSADVGLEKHLKGLHIGASATYDFEVEQVRESSVSTTLTYDFNKTEQSQDEYGWFICSKPDFEVQRYSRRDWSGQAIANSNVFVSNVAADSGDYTYVPFSMTDPSKPDPDFGTTMSAGMKAHPASSDYADPAWGTDPLGASSADYDKVCDPVALTVDTSNSGGVKLQLSKDETSTSSTSNTVSPTLEFAFLKGGYTFASTFENTMSDAQNMTFQLRLPQPSDPDHPQPTDVKRLEVEAYLLKAETAKAYWIPTAFKTNGNLQTPWCVDYRVASYALYGPTAGSDPCRVAVSARPAGAGTVSIAGDTKAPAAWLAVTGADEVSVRARAADGYRFDHWRRFGTQIRVGNRKAARTRLFVTGGGGATAQAIFRRQLPASLSVRRRDADSCDIVIKGADLPAAVTSAWSSIEQRDLRLVVGDDTYVIPGRSWRRKGSRKTATFRPSTWRDRGDRCQLTIDRAKGTWSLRARGADAADDFMRLLGVGRCTVALALDGETLGAGPIPVAAHLRMVVRTLKRPPSVKTSGPIFPVSLKKARLTVKAPGPGSAGKTRFVIEKVKLSKRLFDRRGFTVSVNGFDIRLRGFRKSRGAWESRGRTKAGVAYRCRYSANGMLALTLGGKPLRGLLRDLIGQNVSFKVTAGKLTSQGTMMSVVKSISRLRLVPEG
jgi:hypothetical protein